MIAINIVSYYIQKGKAEPENILLILIISHGSLIFFILFECWLRKTISKKIPSEDKSKGKSESKKILKYIYHDNNKKKLDVKKFLILLLMIILELIYDASLTFYKKINSEYSDLVMEEIYKFMDILFLLLIFRLMHKIMFYRHQYISLFIIILMGLIRFSRIFMKIFKEEMDDFYDYISFSFIIILPLIDSIKMFVLEKYMKDNNYSPFFICFLIGVVYLIFSFIVLVSFRNVDCGDSEICKSLKDIVLKPNIGQIFLLIIYSILYAWEHYMKFYIIYGFTAFHSILIVTFGEVINCFFELFFDFNIIELIIDITTYSLEILGVLVFIETIELNFCKLNINLKKNIIFRAHNETDLIYKEINTEAEENNNGIEIGDVRSDINENSSVSESEYNSDYQSSVNQ